METPLSQAWLEMPDGRMHWLDQGTCTIGRGATCTLMLDAPGVSRSHAIVQPNPGGGYLIADLRSTNGTYVNSLRLEQNIPLRDGDRIEIGDCPLTYRCLQTVGLEADSGQTSIQIHSGSAWLVMLDLIGHTAHTHRVGAEAASADFKRWLELIRPILLQSGGTINAYLGDAVFAYWRQDRHDATKINRMLGELVGLQTSAPRPFRIILHHGAIRISGGQQGESVSGMDVIYLFRIEKSTKGLGAQCVLSEPAASSLQLTAKTRPLGRHLVPDYPGEHEFYGL